LIIGLAIACGFVAALVPSSLVLVQQVVVLLLRRLLISCGARLLINRSLAVDVVLLGGLAVCCGVIFCRFWGLAVVFVAQ
jgi:hypothetical protein